MTASVVMTIPSEGAGWAIPAGVWGQDSLPSAIRTRVQAMCLQTVL
jgi:hypothetical protein